MGVIGIVVIALFSGLFARLWFLQIATASDYVAETTANRTRILTTPAVRGSLLDANGKVIVANTLVDSVQIDRAITPEERPGVLSRLGDMFGLKASDLADRMDNGRYSPYQPVPVADNVPYDKLVYIKENPELFPHVNVVRHSVRSYPNGSVAAALLGYVGAINGAEQKLHTNDHYGPDDVIGQTGIEQIFESELRGTPRVQKLEVDSQGRLAGVLSDTSASAGNDVQLTMDLDIQKVAQDSLEQGVLGARATQDQSIKTGLVKFKAPGGAAVVLNAQDGSIVAMASYPTFDITKFTNGIPADEYQALTDPSNGSPLLNRAVQGTYAPGSTFKLLTALAALENGVVKVDEPIDDKGYIEVGSGAGAQRFVNAGKEVNGVIQLPQAITVSSDVYFYTMGYRFWNNFYNAGDHVKGNGIQTVARQFGFGKSTGSGFTDESPGRIPDDVFKAAFNKNNPDRLSRIWLPGDDMNLAVGQGDVLVTPLQMAAAYAAFETGTLYTPSLAKQVLSPGSTKVLRNLQPNVAAKLSIKPEYRAAIIAGMEGVLQPGGTAALAFDGYTGQAAGKTGTAQVNGKEDTSVFVGMTNPDPAPGTNPPQYVVAVFVEQAGFGSSVAAPIARRIMEGLNGNLNAPPVHVIPTSSNND
jgi:penicillin-binding protein 2